MRTKKDKKAAKTSRLPSPLSSLDKANLTRTHQNTPELHHPQEKKEKLRDSRRKI